MDAAASRLLAQLAASVQERYGFAPPEWLLLARTEERARALGRTLLAYLEDLSVRGAEEPLVARLLTFETRFYRHREQMALLREHLLPASRRTDREVRLWCAGCSTGEEAWTLAMMLAELHLPGSILATDLSEEALATAELGVYPLEAARQLPTDLKRYLLRHDEETVRISDALRQEVPVRFLRQNLLQAYHPAPFDIILCRNVLIYFDAAGRERALRVLWQSLSSDGWLLLGSAEFIEDQQLFEGMSQLGAQGTLVTCYRKRPSEATRHQAGPHLPPARNTGSGLDARPAAVEEPDRAPGRPAIMRLHGSYGDGTRLAEELRGRLPASGSLVIDLDGAGYLGDEDARVIRRAREAAHLELRATRRGVLRWMHKHGLADEGPEQGGG